MTTVVLSPLSQRLARLTLRRDEPYSVSFMMGFVSDDPKARDDLAQRSARWRFATCLGCAAIILAGNGLLAFTHWYARTRTLDDPRAVEQNLATILPSKPPKGYQGFLGMYVPGVQRVAVLLPDTHRGERIRPDAPLVICVWTFPPEQQTDADRQTGMVSYWEETIKNQLGQTPVTIEQGPTSLTLRGGPCPAQLRLLESGKHRLKLISAVVPRAKGGAESVGLSFIGKVDGFDQGGLEAYLATIE